MTISHAQQTSVTPRGTGFDEAFLGVELPVPVARPGAGDGVPWRGRRVLPYTHFSVYLSRERKLARWVAWNIEAATLRSVSRAGIPFTADPRIPKELQTLEDVYSANRLDRGHLARRADLVWGNEAEALVANRESFYFTNITPQMDSFNQSRAGGLWGELENSLLEHIVETPLPRVSVFAGPVLASTDPEYRSAKVPLDFWKVLIYRTADVLSCNAFLLTQDLGGLTARPFEEEYKLYGMALTEVADRAQLRFPAHLHDAVRVTVMHDPQRIQRLSQITWASTQTLDLREPIDVRGLRPRV